jgi:hypothetical protein
MIPKNAARVCLGPVLALALLALLSTAVSSQNPAQFSPQCDAVLSSRFVPRHPVLGGYEACLDPRPLSELLPANWTIEAVEPLDAFGRAGAYNRAALARLYRGTRASVARRWSDTPDRFESVTFISPHPNASLTRLESGTLLIRWSCDKHDRGCRTPAAR